MSFNLAKCLLFWGFGIKRFLPEGVKEKLRFFEGENTSARIYAEAMYGSILWQVVREDLASGEFSAIEKDLSQLWAQTLANRLQQAIDETLRIEATTTK